MSERLAIDDVTMSTTNRSDTKHLTLFFTPSRVGGGVGKSLLDLAIALAEQGHRVDLLFSRAEGPYLHQVPTSVTPIVLNSLPGGFRMVRSLLPTTRRMWGFMMSLVLVRTFRYLPALVQYLQQQQPAALIAAKTYPNLAALWARRLAGVSTRIIVTERTNLSQEVRMHTTQWHWHWYALPRIIRHFYSWADAIVAVSDGVADDLVRSTGLPREWVTTIYNPVVTRRLPEQVQMSLSHPWFATGGPPVILAAGRLEPQKDFPTLLKAFARVRSSRDVRLVILGEGNGRAALQALARQLGMATDVDFPGFVDNPFPYMARAAVFVLSSTHEGLPGVLIQAMACGCPVVSTDCPSGPREILTGGIAPLITVGDDKGLAQAIITVLDHSPDRERLRAQAALFSAEWAVERYLEVCGGDRHTADSPRAISYAQ